MGSAADNQGAADGDGPTGAKNYDIVVNTRFEHVIPLVKPEARVGGVETALKLAGSQP